MGNRCQCAHCSSESHTCHAPTHGRTDARKNPRTHTRKLALCARPRGCAHYAVARGSAHAHTCDARPHPLIQKRTDARKHARAQARAQTQPDLNKRHGAGAHAHKHSHAAFRRKPARLPFVGIRTATCPGCDQNVTRTGPVKQKQSDSKCSGCDHDQRRLRRPQPVFLLSI